MSEHNSNPGSERWIDTKRGKVVAWSSILALISVAPAMVAVTALYGVVNGAYLEYHDRHNYELYYTREEVDSNFAKKDEIIVLAQVSVINTSIAQAQKTANANSSKLDFLVKSEAAKTVQSIRQELAFHKASNDGSQLWQREKANIEARLSRAEDYKRCVIEGRPDCDAERIW